jgi:hypothetical protein
MEPDFDGAREVVGDVIVGEVVLPDGATISVLAPDLGGSQDVDVIDALPLKQVTAAIESIANGFQDAMTKVKPKRSPSSSASRSERSRASWSACWPKAAVRPP